jgi:hypothetical protein
MVDDRDSVGHIDLGRPGASARAEFERRLRRDAERRRRRFGRFLAALVAVLAGSGHPPHAGGSGVRPRNVWAAS